MSQQTERILTAREAAEYLRMKPNTLAQLRMNGGGPRYSRVSPDPRSKVLYRQSALDLFLDQREFGSALEEQWAS